MKYKITVELISFLFILLFLYAAISKLLDYDKFVVQIGQSPLLTGLGDLVPPTIISIEFIISLLLAFPSSRSIGFYFAFSLMVMFTAYIYAILYHSSFIPCSCGGILENLSWTQHMIFNIVFIVLATIGIYLESNSKKINLETVFEKVSPTAPNLK